MRNLRNWALAVTAVLALTGLSAAQGRWDRDDDRDRGHNPKAEGRHDNGNHYGWWKHDRDGDRDRDRERGRTVYGPVYPNGGYRYPAGGYYGYPNSGNRYPNGYGYPSGGYYGGYPYGYPGGGYGNGGYYGGYGNGGYYGGGARQAFGIGYHDGMRHGQSDRMSGHSYRPTHDDDYRNADRGYSSAYGNRQAYKDQYRNGYMQGYNSGYNRGGYGR